MFHISEIQLFLHFLEIFPGNFHTIRHHLIRPNESAYCWPEWSFLWKKKQECL